MNSFSFYYKDKPVIVSMFDISEYLGGGQGGSLFARFYYVRCSQGSNTGIYWSLLS